MEKLRRGSKGDDSAEREAEGRLAVAGVGDLGRLAETAECERVRDRDLAAALHHIAETRGGNHCCNSAVGKKNRGNWKKGQSPPLLLEVGIYGGSPELFTSPRTNAGGLESHVRCGCWLPCSVLPDAITSGMEVGALNFAAILLVH
nr:hypothetical protein Iba_chr15aCG6420 [Ipomoea batatas]